MKISFSLEGKSPLKQAQIESIERAISASMGGPGEYFIGLSFVSQDVIQKMNNSYAGNNYPTDVLSFDYSESVKGGAIGDIAVCTQLAKAQAKEYDTSLEAELSLLVVHGALHILGEDHQTNAEITSLDQLQSDIMSTMNYKYRDFKWSH